MNTVNDYQGPLAGLNVIDFGHYYAGPMAAMLLADQGANVVRVVKPGKAELPSQQYRLLNRNKKLLKLDIKTNEGQAQALSLIQKADVVIENFRPGVMKRLSLDYSSVKANNPGLIYLSLPGFASTDKKRAHIQAWEGVLAAATGIFNHLSLFRESLKYPPLYTSIPLCSAYGSIHGAVAIMAALIARETYGVGNCIEVPLATGGITPFASMILPGSLDEKVTEDCKPLCYQASDSIEIQQEKLEKARLATLPFGYMDYLCGDGRRIHIAVVNQSVVTRFTIILGIEKQLYREGFVIASEWLTDVENNLGALQWSSLNDERKQRFREIVTQALKSKGAEEWEALLQKNNVPVAMLRTREEWLALEPLHKASIFTQMAAGETTLTVPGRLVDVSGPEDVLKSVTPAEPQTLNFDQAQKVLQQGSAWSGFNLDNQGSVKALKKGELLRGLKVLDLGNILAGPIAGHILAEYGAEVIKADSSGPGAYYPGLIYAIADLNQGKRSILTDAKSVQGKAIMERLVSWADVVSHNILDDTAERLGITHTQLQAINKDIVSLQVSAYGGTYRGAWEGRPSFDNLLQSACGLFARSGSLDSPHWHGNIASGDVPCGISAAFAALLGVYQQRKTGYGGECRASLARAMNYSQLPWMIKENGNSEWYEPRGQFAVGPHMGQRLYACLDGWIFVGTTKSRTRLLAETVTGRKEADEADLVAAFIEQDSDIWLQKLHAVDIGCHPVTPRKTIFDQAEKKLATNEAGYDVAQGTHEFIQWQDHASGLQIAMPAPDHVRLGEDHHYWRPAPASRLGEHTRIILQELGYKEEEIKELIRLKVSHEFYPPLGSIHAFFEQKPNS